MSKLRLVARPDKGRPQKYADVLMALEDHDLYTPSLIATLAVEGGFVDNTALGRQRVRITMARLTGNHGFPKKGDGMVTIKGQAPTPGWWGHRWKNAARVRSVERRLE